MIKPGRLLFLILLVTGFVVAGIQLRSQGVAFSQVASTGIGFFAGLLGLFLFLLAVGRLLGKLSRERRE